MNIITITGVPDPGRLCPCRVIPPLEIKSQHSFRPEERRQSKIDNRKNTKINIDSWFLNPSPGILRFLFEKYKFIFCYRNNVPDNHANYCQALPRLKPIQKTSIPKLLLSGIEPRPFSCSSLELTTGPPKSSEVMPRDSRESEIDYL